MSTLDIRNTTRERIPGFSYAAVASTILPHWELSLVFAGEKRAQTINKKLRNKDYIPNVLSYTLGERSGEVIICLKEARRQAPSFDMTYKEFVGYLFIHGLSHLKGYQHGTTMERYEESILRTYAPKHIALTNETKNRNRN